MKAVVESWEKRFQRWKLPVRRTAAKLGRFLGIRIGQVEIYLVGNQFMKKNVLAFPAPKGFPRPDVKGKHLGEIYLNPDYIENHGEDLTYMLTHGFLHLLGYLHDKKSDRIRMEKKEQELLRRVS